MHHVGERAVCLAASPKTSDRTLRVEAGQEVVQLGTSELPLERLGDLLVVSAEGQQRAFELVEVGEVVGLQHLALSDAEVDLGLVQP